ncbi:alkylmercury lyase [Rhodococcoides kyotonense]|uniref:Alkylmercury lyase n=1 Tax=Rhodococcoides kyotonense TaxID=398843 RepID=A0A177YH13_9NOCA|nr:alkylmercury lyase [Rhodococcus kyotonensis]OAK54846.1 alkylmercury lyase [Rhodococcus kyotonensis]
MKVEILYFDGCPNWQEAADRVRAAASLIGQSDIEIGRRLISSDAEAAASAFAGSPTILVDGVDAFDDAVQLTELAYRVYSTDRGLAGLPTVDQLAASLRSKGEALQR